MNQARFLPKKVLNMKLKEKSPKGKWVLKRKPEVWEDITQKKMERVDLRLSDNPHEVDELETSTDKANDVPLIIL